MQERTAGNPCPSRPSRVPVQSEKLASQRAAIGTFQEIRCNLIAALAKHSWSDTLVGALRGKGIY